MSQQLAASSNPRECVKRARWYLNQVDALIVTFAGKTRMDEDERMQCQAMLREVKARFSIDKTTPQAEREASPVLVEYHARMLEAGARLTMATHTTPSTARWREPLNACRTDLVNYLAEMQRRYPTGSH